MVIVRIQPAQRGKRRDIEPCGGGDSAGNIVGVHSGNESINSIVLQALREHGQDGILGGRGNCVSLLSTAGFPPRTVRLVEGLQALEVDALGYAKVLDDGGQVIDEVLPHLWPKIVLVL